MLTLLAAAALAASPVHTPLQYKDQFSLLVFADAFDRAQLSKDGVALERMVADGLVFIDGSGKRQDKKAFIAGWTDPGDSYEPVTLSDRTITMLGEDAGIVGAEVTLRGYRAASRSPAASASPIRSEGSAAAGRRCTSR